MKKYDVYKNIRKQAMIMGLPISLFALLMVSVIGSLLVIIFSFSLMVILSVLAFNIGMYVVLTYITNKPTATQLQKVFPVTISNKRISPVDYEED